VKRCFVQPLGCTESRLTLPTGASERVRGRAGLGPHSSVIALPGNPVTPPE
jgi:hypothetical protein